MLRIRLRRAAADAAARHVAADYAFSDAADYAAAYAITPPDAAASQRDAGYAADCRRRRRRHYTPIAAIAATPLPPPLRHIDAAR